MIETKKLERQSTGSVVVQIIRILDLQAGEVKQISCFNWFYLKQNALDKILIYLICILSCILIYIYFYLSYLLSVSIFSH